MSTSSSTTIQELILNTYSRRQSQAESYQEVGKNTDGTLRRSTTVCKKVYDIRRNLETFTAGYQVGYTYKIDSKAHLVRKSKSMRAPLLNQASSSSSLCHSRHRRRYSTRGYGMNMLTPARYSVPLLYDTRHTGSRSMWHHPPVGTKYLHYCCHPVCHPVNHEASTAAPSHTGRGARTPTQLQQYMACPPQGTARPSRCQPITIIIP